MPEWSKDLRERAAQGLSVVGVCRGCSRVAVTGVKAGVKQRVERRKFQAYRVLYGMGWRDGFCPACVGAGVLATEKV